MKKALLLFLVLLLLTGCAAKPASDPSETVETADELRDVIGVWRNAGQYSEGRDFVETLTLNEDGSCTVHLEYQGEDYQTLEGSYTVENGVLSVDYRDQSGSVSRSFQYTRDGRELILKTEAKTVTYLKVD